MAVQIALTADAAASMFERTKASQPLEAFNAYVNAATKLQRTMVAQIEALAKLQRGGAQSVRVEHVHVHQGGQAIVGAVTLCPTEFVKATGEDTFLLRTERRLQSYEVAIISRESKIPIENIVAGVVTRAQLLKLVAVLTKPRPMPDPHGEFVG